MGVTYAAGREANRRLNDRLRHLSLIDRSDVADVGRRWSIGGLIDL